MYTYTNIYNDAKPEKELYFELGRTLITQNKFRKAIEFLQEAQLLTGSIPANWEIFYLLGEGFRNLSKTKEAFENYIDAAISIHDETAKSQFYKRAESLINFNIVNGIRDYLQTKLSSETLSQPDARSLADILKYTFSFNDKIAADDNTKYSSHEEIQTFIEDALHSISKNEYKTALVKIEQGLTKNPNDYEILFIKLRILIEGQIDLAAATELFNDEEFGYRKQFKSGEIISKLDQILASTPEKGDTYFFTAFIANLMDHDRNVIKAWLNKAESLGLKNDNVYPLIGLYLLKAEIAEKEHNMEDAAVNLLDAAKCYYWQAGYTQAAKYFEKAIQLNSALNEAYNYYADTLFLLSYQPDPPYNIQELIDKAFNAWYDSPGKKVAAKSNAWYYIVIARIHEIRYKFRKVNFYEDLWQSVLYAERTLIHDDDFFSFWTYLGKFYRNLGMNLNSMAALEIAQTLNADDEVLKEEIIIQQLSIGEYERPLAYLKELKERSLKNPGDYKSYHRSWEGYIIFHDSKKLREAAKIFDELGKELNTDLYSRQMKMICHWHAHELQEARETAREIIDLGSKYNYPKEEFTFSWAFFINGQPGEAITILQTVIKNGGNVGDNSFSLLQFYLYAGQMGKAKDAFIIFIGVVYNKKDLQDALQSLDALEFMFQNEKQGSDISLKEFRDTITVWKKQIHQRLDYIAKTIFTKENELKTKQAEYNVKDGSIPFIAIQAGLARVYRNDKNLLQSYMIYNELIKYDADFPEAPIALGQIEDEVFNLTRSKIKDSKYIDAIEYIGQFDINDPEKAQQKNRLLSLAYFGSGNEEKSIKNLQGFYGLIENDGELQKKIWLEITGNAYDHTLIWNFGHFLRTNMTDLHLASGGPLMESMRDNFWTAFFNKGGDLYPVVTSIAIEISTDLVTIETSSPDWYVIKKLIPAMQERINQKLGVKLPGVRIRENESDLSSGNYIISLDEIPRVQHNVQMGELFITEAREDLQALSVTGRTGLNPISGKESIWVDAAFKELLDTNNISYWQDPFEFIIAHLETFLEQNLGMFIDTQFCNEYLENFAQEIENSNSGDLLENAKIIRDTTTLLLLFSEVLKGLVREKVPIINKQIIIGSFINANKIWSDANELIQVIRIDLKKELPVNNLQSRAFELPPQTERNIKDELITAEGKTFLAMIPQNCQEALSEVRNIVMNDTDHLNLMLLTNDSPLRIHLRKLVELEFPNLLVASREELMDS